MSPATREYLTDLNNFWTTPREWSKDYASGKLLTGNLKARLIEVLQKLVGTHQEARAKVDDETLMKFFEIRRYPCADNFQPTQKNEGGKQKDQEQDEQNGNSEPAAQ